MLCPCSPAGSCPWTFRCQELSSVFTIAESCTCWASSPPLGMKFRHPLWDQLKCHFLHETWSQQEAISLDLAYLAHLFYQTTSSLRARQCLMILVFAVVSNIRPTIQFPTEQTFTEILLYAKVSFYEVGYNTDMWCFVAYLSLKIIVINLASIIHMLSL